MAEKDFTYAGRCVSIHTKPVGRRHWDWSGSVDGKPFRNTEEPAPNEATAIEEAAAYARSRIDDGSI